MLFSPQLTLRYHSGIPELARPRNCVVALKREALLIGRIRIPFLAIRDLSVIRAAEARGGTIGRGIVGAVMFGPLGGIIGALSARDAAKKFFLAVQYADPQGGQYTAALSGHVRDLPRAERLRDKVLQARAVAERRRVDPSFSPRSPWRTLKRLVTAILLGLAALVIYAALRNP